MTRVSILTNMDEQCGNATYARNLARELSHWYDVQLTDQCPQTDVVIVNWHPARITVTAEMIRGWRAAGRKVILILQNSHVTANGHRLEPAPDDILFSADAVVAHEPVPSAAPIHYIPHGILEFGELPQWLWSQEKTENFCIGTAGFPFPWKRPDVVARAAGQLGCYAYVPCPPYPGWDWTQLVRDIGRQSAKVRVDYGWQSEEEIVRRLAVCAFNIFWFESHGLDDQLGQSGSVRLGLAAWRPTILSRHRKFRDLFPYEDELYFAETQEDVYRLSAELVAALQQGRKVKHPYRVLQDMAWSRSAEKYRVVIERVLS